MNRLNKTTLRPTRKLATEFQPHKVPNEYGVYVVIGKRQYRGHAPGTRFEARLEPAAAQRAINRGDIELIEMITPALEPGSYRLPSDWPSKVNEPGERVSPGM